MFDHLEIKSPKRSKRTLSGWESFFPYYAGFPESFVRSILATVGLPKGAAVLDPWNGSGTTTYCASTMGFRSFGIDINPTMIVVARARLLPPSEADSLEPIASEILKTARRSRVPSDPNDPLKQWFGDRARDAIRAIERSIQRHLLGPMTVSAEGANLAQMSGTAATMYVALFTVCRELAAAFKASNPTWLKVPKAAEDRLDFQPRDIHARFISTVQAMTVALMSTTSLPRCEASQASLQVNDTTTWKGPAESIDLVLTSPPYCTRIDYAAATRLELAILSTLAPEQEEEISRRMIGSTRVAKHLDEPQDSWGERCLRFLDAVKSHGSRASSGYYYKTHVDYFQKMDKSIQEIASVLRGNGKAILVVQDSHYKEIHNDLQSITADIASAHGLTLARRADFHIGSSLAGRNPHTKVYRRLSAPIESVLCFSKN